MELVSLTAISPVDGRYRRNTEVLSPYFSEYGLIKYRVLVEIEYFIYLAKLPLPAFKDKFNVELEQKLRNVYIHFSQNDALRIKEIEKTTNHDVKAVEYFIKEKLKGFGIDDLLEYIHFGLTSQDINNTAIPLSIKEALEKEIWPVIDELIQKLEEKANEWNEVSLLARTHGQPASPTKLGKEIRVFIERLRIQLGQIKQIPYSAKFGGATGNFNAHHVAFPEINWVNEANQFVNQVLGLNRSQYTTQIEHYDNLAALFDGLKRVDTILIDFCRDMWSYISMDYFKQKIKEGEIGSSAMPHKVNPIDFENAEGNLGIANSIFEFLSGKLPISRLQRDLTDSTVLRNVGVPLAHQLIALKSILKGVDKVLLNKTAIDSDLEENWAVVAEAIQTILRREGFEKPYEALKDLTRTNTKINKDSIHAFIENLKINEKVKEELKKIDPFNYSGVY